MGGCIQPVSLLEKAGISGTILNTLNLEVKSNLLSQLSLLSNRGIKYIYILLSVLGILEAFFC